MMASGARNRPTVRRPFSKRSSAGLSFCSPRLRYVPALAISFARSRPRSPGDALASLMRLPLPVPPGRETPQAVCARRNGRIAAVSRAGSSPIGQWPHPSRSFTSASGKTSRWRCGELHAEVGVARAVDDQGGRPDLPQRRRLAVLDVLRVRGAVELEHRALGAGVDVVVHAIEERPRERLRVAAVDQHPHAGAGRDRLEQLAQHGRPPDPREDVPAVADEDARVDQREAREAVGMPDRPLQAPRPAEVVQHQVRALDPEADEQPVEVPRVALDRVREHPGAVGAAEAGHVGRHDAGELGDRGHDLLPVAPRAGVPVQEHDGLARVGRASPGDGRRHARHGDGLDVHAASMRATLRGRNSCPGVIIRFP